MVFYFQFQIPSLVGKIFELVLMSIAGAEVQGDPIRAWHNFNVHIRRLRDVVCDFVKI